MANPQKENGHIDIANEIAEVLAKTNFRPYEWRTLWALWRKTWGWHKKEDKISLTQFQNLTGLERRHQRKALKTLTEKNIIIRRKDGYIVTYGFQKDYTQWKVVLKQAPVSNVLNSAQISTTLVPKQAPKLVPKPAPTKENKETIQKKDSPPYIQKIISFYKKLKGYDSQPEWNTYHYKRHVRPAKQLYEMAPEEWEEAMEWVSRQGYQDWTIETVIRKLPDYKKYKDQKSSGAAWKVLNE